ncbi:hypothetical protein P3T36_002509 [Kitasatospora sp. MAP12-15]|uniref:hypothetical protein n=1 Tax=unclassified Kitasatospora TaxID=2633591 RepID=UPI0024748CBA|nr:hypothetical protein [Kitasatospora sp. MAP12-44]MDH6112791.1 hypothetical protein [Kitasatospora sp. MAP12-44]
MRILAAVQQLKAGNVPWGEIDQLILDNRKIHAIQLIRAEFGDGLREAVDRLRARYDELRRERPGGFNESHGEYWDGFES